MKWTEITEAYFVPVSSESLNFQVLTQSQPELIIMLFGYSISLTVKRESTFKMCKISSSVLEMLATIIITWTAALARCLKEVLVGGLLGKVIEWTRPFCRMIFWS